jgi:hypothetical protein
VSNSKVEIEVEGIVIVILPTSVSISDLSFRWGRLTPPYEYVFIKLWKIFLMLMDIQKGLGAKSYMRTGFKQRKVTQVMYGTVGVL